MTDAALQAMSHQLNEYGALPIRAEIMQKRSVDNQTFYQVKLVFPRGDATSLLLGFDAEGKVTGLAIMSMAGEQPGLRGWPNTVSSLQAAPFGE